MRSAVWLFLLALVCVAIAWWISLLPGAVTATVGGTTFQTSTPVAILLIGVVFALAYAVLRLLAWAFSVPRRHRRWRGDRNRTKGELALNRALIALAANDPGAARREAERGRRLLGDTPMTLLLAAQAGKQAGRDDEATAYYEQLADRPDARLLGLRGLVRLAIEQQDWERATALAEQAERAHPKARWLQDERGYMAQRTGRWQDALRLASPDTKPALAVAAAENETDPKARLALARQAYEAEPSLTRAAVVYASALREGGRARQANEILRQAWSIRPHPELAEAFVADVADPQARARDLELLTSTNPDNEETYLVRGRAAYEAGMVAEAREQVERARLAGVNDRRYWQLQADVCLLEGHADLAQEALRHLPGADPDPQWRCDVCGTFYERWHATCETCRSVGSIRWGQPVAAKPSPVQAEQLLGGSTLGP